MILAIADDLTAALEVGAQFANFGIQSCVTTEREIADWPDALALVIDTETRHLPENEAAAIVRGVASGARRFNPWLVYKKTDSTLRGNIAAEFRAMVEAMPGKPLVYAPAYPEMGRTVRGGRLFVHGIEVHRSAFANDPMDPVRTSNIAELLGGVAVKVWDGESSDDIAAAAREILAHDPPALAAGPASLAGALAAAIALRPGNRDSPALPRLPRCLVVNGSRHPDSAVQIAFAREHQCLDDEWIYVEHSPRGSGIVRAANLGEHVRFLLRTAALDGLIVFGGDTAFGILHALGGRRFEACGEVVPGVPVSRCGALYWVTKAGGFGSPDLLCEIRKRLT
jgi:uncharacterized protein YgbK (DUF1537 family)